MRAFKHHRKEHLADIKYTRDRPVSTRVNKHSNHTGKSSRQLLKSLILILNYKAQQISGEKERFIGFTNLKHNRRLGLIHLVR